MKVNTTKVQGRRELTFRSLDDVAADAEMLVSSPTVRTLGNWPLTNLLTHLTITFNNSIDGFPVRAPLFIRLLGPFIKGSVLRAPKMSPGIRLPKAAEPAVFPDAASPQAAMKELRSAIARARTEQMVAPHPAFGRMTHDEWLTLHLRHCELHLSYALPG